MPVLDLIAVIACERDEVVRCQAELRGIEVVHPVDRVSAAARQTWIGRRGHVERVEIGGREDAVVGDARIAVRAAEVGDID